METHGELGLGGKVGLSALCAFGVWRGGRYTGTKKDLGEATSTGRRGAQQVVDDTTYLLEDLKLHP